MTDKRTVETLKNKNWINTSFKDLKPGDLFRMFEPGGESVTDSKGNTSWVVKSPPFVNKDKVLEIEVEL